MPDKNVHLYFLSGLGSDKRIFDRLQLDHPTTYIEWLEPEKNEPVDSYVQRLSGQVTDFSNAVYIGVSFGGMIIQKLAELKPPRAIILLSSISSESERPFYIKIGKATRLHKIVPVSLFKYIYPLFYRNMGARSAEDRKLLKDFVTKTSNRYMRWAVDRIIDWKFEPLPCPVYKIHGTADKVFPINYFKPDITIDDGTHFMTYNRADDVSLSIRSVLGKIE